VQAPLWQDALLFKGMTLVVVALHSRVWHEDCSGFYLSGMKI